MNRALHPLLSSGWIGIALLAAPAAVLDWRPVAQPDLVAALDAAPNLEFEALAAGPDACWEGPLWWVPNPDGKTWDMVFIYSKNHQGPHEVFAYDTATQALMRFEIPGPGNNFHIVPYLPRPWTAGRASDHPPADDATSTTNKSLSATRDTNPAHVATLKDFTDVHMPWAASIGADGRIYFGGKVVRIGNGGGLGWWDTRKQETGGLHEPFERDTIHWMCRADAGRYIVCSTRGRPKSIPSESWSRTRSCSWTTTSTWPAT